MINIAQCMNYKIWKLNWAIIHQIYQNLPKIGGLKLIIYFNYNLILHRIILFAMCLFILTYNFPKCH